MPLQTFPHTVNLDGLVDERGIEYVGWATLQPSGRFECLAKLTPTGPLVRAEVTVRSVPREPEPEPGSLPA